MGMICRGLLLLAALVLSAPAAIHAQDDERTAVVISLERRRLPELDEMQNWFTVAGQPARVVAAERGPAEVIVVRDPAAQPYLDILARAALDMALGFEPEPTDFSEAGQSSWNPEILQLDDDAFAAAGQQASRSWRRLSTERLAASREKLKQLCDLGEGTRLLFLSPLAAQVSRIVHQTNVFNVTHAMPVGDKGFLSFVGPASTLRFARRFADAVAVAGDQLAAEARRRAVLVLIEGASNDESLYAVPTVREHMAQLQIPVFVWWFGPGAFAGGWKTRYLISAEVDKVEPDHDLENLETACQDLKSTLEAQRIVWLDGLHFFEDVELSPDVSGVRLAGTLMDGG